MFREEYSFTIYIYFFLKLLSLLIIKLRGRLRFEINQIDTQLKVKRSHQSAVVKTLDGHLRRLQLTTANTGLRVPSSVVSGASLLAQGTSGLPGV